MTAALAAARRLWARAARRTLCGLRIHSGRIDHDDRGIVWTCTSGGGCGRELVVPWWEVRA